MSKVLFKYISMVFCAVPFRVHPFHQVLAAVHTYVSVPLVVGPSGCSESEFLSPQHVPEDILLISNVHILLCVHTGR